jgi:hypothetical protein
MTTRSSLTVYQVARTGVKPVYVAAGAGGALGDSIANDGRVILNVKNGAGAPITVTIQTPGTVDGLAIAEQIVTVTNAEERWIGPFPPNIYNQADNCIYVDYSAVTTITVAALRI